MSIPTLSTGSPPAPVRPAGLFPRLAAGALFAGTGTVSEDAARIPRPAAPDGLRATLRAVFAGASSPEGAT